MKQTLKRLLPGFAVQAIREARRGLFDIYATRSYSQEGEDRVLVGLMHHDILRNGFYVDVGAHDPHRYSNTFLFYRAGWRGVNIDANPESIRLLARFRPRDINVEAAISRERGEMTYYEYDEPALNRLCAGDPPDMGPDVRILRTRKVITQPLGEILAANIPAGQAIDFMSIDIEGFDLQALQSNNWQNFKPTFIAVEQLSSTVRQAQQGPLADFLNSLGYEFVAKTLNTLFFSLRDRPIPS